MNSDFFNATVQQWYDPLYRFAVSTCRDPEDALDLTQNAFHKLAQKGHTLRDPSKVKSWLFSTVYREYIDQYRKRQRYPVTGLDLVPETADPDGHNRAERSFDAEQLLHFLGEMDEKFKAPLTLFYLQCFSYKEIADILDIPIGTVMSRLRRGKDRLRERMETVSATPALRFPQHVPKDPPPNFPQNSHQDFPQEARNG